MEHIYNTAQTTGSHNTSWRLAFEAESASGQHKGIMYHEVTPGLLALSTAHSVLIQGGFSTEKPRVHSKTVLKLVVELLTYRLVSVAFGTVGDHLDDVFSEHIFAGPHHCQNCNPHQLQVVFSSNVTSLTVERYPRRDGTPAHSESKRNLVVEDKARVPQPSKPQRERFYMLLPDKMCPITCSRVQRPCTTSFIYTNAVCS